ncbi:hypothetical protein D0N36_14445 [Hymenobacter lapidiphilus]|uniref:hypothetical protein n=1 Tax=Hymenobacter sp. CCM 8763 TaxID=2303334 RepID=UPI000E356FEC|nr:hypothetical protein [Hymenobacter sp. CCM 8763]RFP64385.1 hypothetical protein D0N36_14445 [Hymenobacter sp. CCM 8763]
MKTILLACCAVLATPPVYVYAQSADARPDSVRVALRQGADDAELNQLLSHVLGVERLRVEVTEARLAGKHLLLTYQEYRQGVASPEKEVVAAESRLSRFDSRGHFGLEVYARQATDSRLDNVFVFAAGRNTKSFQAMGTKGSLYSMRADIWPYQLRKSPAADSGQRPTLEHHFPVGKKVPFLVYTLPYEADGYLQYCSLAQSKVAPAEWYTKFKVEHFVVYYLLIH